MTPKTNEIVLAPRLAAKLAREEATTLPCPVLPTDPVWCPERRAYFFSRSR